MNIKPFGDRILVRPSKPSDKTDFGLILSEAVDPSRLEGEVVAIGNGDAAVNSGLKIGDRIIYKRYSGQEFFLGQGTAQEKYVILYVGSGEDRNDVVATFEENS